MNIVDSSGKKIQKGPDVEAKLGDLGQVQGNVISFALQLQGENLQQASRLLPEQVTISKYLETDGKVWYLLQFTQVAPNIAGVTGLLHATSELLKSQIGQEIQAGPEEIPTKK